MRSWRPLIAALGIALIAGACGDGATPAASTTPKTGPAIAVASNDFAESQIVAEIFALVLEENGYTVDRKGTVGARPDSFAALKSAEVDAMPEYVASLLEYANDFAGEATGDVDETLTKLREEVSDDGIVVLEPSQALDTNAIATNQETADAHDLATLSDLAEVADQLVLGAPAECSKNAFCTPGLKKVYGIEFKKHEPLSEGPLIEALEQNAVQAATVYSTQGVIAARGFIILQDDKGLFGADYIVPVLSEEASVAYGDDLATLLNSVGAKLTTAGVTELNKRVEIDKEDVEDVAADWATTNGFLT